MSNAEMKRMTDPADHARSSRDLELVQVVWLRALGSDLSHDRVDELELVQLAGNEPTVLEHAIRYGTKHQGECGTARQAASALDALEHAAALVAHHRAVRARS